MEIKSPNDKESFRLKRASKFIPPNILNAWQDTLIFELLK